MSLDYDNQDYKLRSRELDSVKHVYWFKRTEENYRSLLDFLLAAPLLIPVDAQVSTNAEFLVKYDEGFNGDNISDEDLQLLTPVRLSTEDKTVFPVFTKVAALPEEWIDIYYFIYLTGAQIFSLTERFPEINGLQQDPFLMPVFFAKDLFPHTAIPDI